MQMSAGVIVKLYPDNNFALIFVRRIDNNELAQNKF
jgi:hypothetical protein